MSVFHNDPSDPELERRARLVRHRDRRTEVRAHRRTAAHRSPGQAHERASDRQMRSARQAAAVRSHGPSTRVSESGRQQARSQGGEAMGSGPLPPEIFLFNEHYLYFSNYQKLQEKFRKL